MPLRVHIVFGGTSSIGRLGSGAVHAMVLYRWTGHMLAQKVGTRSAFKQRFSDLKGFPLPIGFFLPPAILAMSTRSSEHDAQAKS